jgi:hypothetical protein
VVGLREPKQIKGEIQMKQNTNFYMEHKHPKVKEIFIVNVRSPQEPVLVGWEDHNGPHIVEYTWEQASVALKVGDWRIIKEF